MCEGACLIGLWLVRREVVGEVGKSRSFGFVREEYLGFFFYCSCVWWLGGSREIFIDEWVLIFFFF